MSTQAPPGHRPAAAHPGWAGAAPNEWRPAGFWRRTGAALLDMLVIGVGIAIALGVIGGVAGRRASAVDRGDPGSLVLAAAIQAVVFLAPLVSITLGWWTGGTLGMRAAGCRLVDATSGEKPSVEQILLRLAGSFYSLIALGAGFLWVGLSPTKTGWHDHLSGTVVVHGRPARPRWTEMGWQWMPQSTAPAPADGRVSPAAPAPRSPWTWTDVVPVLILFIPAALLGQLAVVVTLRATGVGRAHHAATSLALDVVAYAADLCLLWLFLGVRRRARLADLGLVRPRGRWLAAGLPAVVIAFVVEAILGEVGTALFPTAPENQCHDIRAAYGSSLWLALLGVAVVAPVAEEVVFRGTVFGWLRRRLPSAAAIVVSSVIFSAAHLGYLQWSLLLPVFGIGCVLATLYHYSRSLWPGIVVHAAINTTGILVLVVGNRQC